jgi:small acid-soluble spore protein H (minor)
MDKRRATEIASSPEMIHVTYNGEPIYIEDVNPNKDKASVHYLNRPDYSQEVELVQLVESKW